MGTHQPVDTKTTQTGTVKSTSLGIIFGFRGVAHLGLGKCGRKMGSLGLADAPIRKKTPISVQTAQSYSFL